MEVSTHAPAWGATQPRQGDARGTESFNPRARMGRDCLLGKWLIIKSKVNSFCEHGKGHRRLYVYFFVNKRNCLNLSFCESHGVSCNGDSSQK